MSARRWRIGLAVILLVGLGLRLAVFLDSRSWIVLRVPVLDAGFYDTSARGLLDGTWPGREPYFMGPMYSYLLGGIYKLFGAGVANARVFQILLGGLGIWLVARAGRRIFGTEAGLVAGALTALYGPLVYYEQVPLMETALTVAAVALLDRALVLWGGPRADAGQPASAGAEGGGAAPVGRLRGALAAFPGGGWGSASLLGVLAGAVIAMRGTSILYAIPVALLLRGRMRPAHGWLAVAATAAVVAPFTVHNWRAGSRALLSTNLGWNLFIGNGPQADGRFAYPNGWEAERDVTGHRFASRVAGRALTPDETNAFWTDRAVQAIREDPSRVAVLAARKATLFLRADEIPQNESFRFFQMNVAPARAAGVGWWLVLPFAIAGLAAGRRAARPLKGATLGFALVPLLTCVAFFVTSRYRLPAVPFLIVLAAGGITGVLDTGRGPAARFVPFVLALAGSTALLLLPASYHLSREISQEYGHVGLRYHAEGALRVAEEHYRKAIALDPRNGDALNNLGAALVALGHDGDAAQAYEKAIESQPQNPIPYVNLAMVRGRQGDDAAAERHLRRASELDPRNAQVFADLGTALARQGKLLEAIEVFERALSLDPSNEGVRGKLLTAREMADALGGGVAP